MLALLDSYPGDKSSSSLQSRWVVLLACSLLICLNNSSSGQARLTEPRSIPGSSTATPLPQERTSKRVETKPTVRGDTYVALASGLKRLSEGADPTSLADLRSLESQQARVASQIEAVTVNIQQGAAQGSGVIITPNGYVLTAAHVAGGAGRSATLILSDGTRVRARTLGLNKYKDAGLLQIEPGQRDSWPYATLGKSRELSIGQWVIAAGHPGGWKENRGSVIRGGRILKIKANRNQESGKLSAHTLFTDCALIGGDSGGPLFTLEGRLVGIHSRIGTKVEENMHVPIDVFDESWDRLVDGEVWGVLPGYQPWLGVKGSTTDDRPIVDEVTRGSPAQRAGLLPGDLILTFDSVKITTFDELKMGVEARMPGDTIVLSIRRKGEVLRIPVVIGHIEP
ncbi:MAG: S1C family serine protease [Aureliella sp.]